MCLGTGQLLVFSISNRPQKLLSKGVILSEAGVPSESARWGDCGGGAKDMLLSHREH